MANKKALVQKTSNSVVEFFGVQGCTGAQGGNGNDGKQGVTGVQGATGAKGSQGVTGAVGSQGVTGAQGKAGIQGTQGAQGATGVGTQGATGVAGPEGSQGIQGIQGIQGVQGVQGSQGIQGEQGVQGVQGATGAAGMTGAAGPQGIQGVQGSQGIAGTDGSNGSQGMTGATGADGLDGEQGTQGVTGLEGATGVAGLDGSDGSQGATGLGSVGATGVAGALGVNIPVVASDPSAPTLNQQWILNLPPSGTSLPASFTVTDNSVSVAQVTPAQASVIINIASGEGGQSSLTPGDTITVANGGPVPTLTFVSSNPSPSQVLIAPMAVDCATNLANVLNTSGIFTASVVGPGQVKMVAGSNWNGTAGNALTVVVNTAVAGAIQFPNSPQFSGGALGIPGTGFELFDGNSGFSGSIVAGPNWTPGTDVNSDAAAIANAMNLAFAPNITFPGWIAVATGNVIVLTNNQAGFDPKSFLAVSGTGFSVVSNLGVSSNPESYTLKIQGNSKVFTMPFN